MICPSKLSTGQLAKFTDEELVELYMQETMRWKDKYGRVWMVFRRFAMIEEVNNKVILKPTSIDFVNIDNEEVINVGIKIIASRIRGHELMRVQYSK